MTSAFFLPRKPRGDRLSGKAGVATISGAIDKISVCDRVLTTLTLNKKSVTSLL